MKRRGKKDLGRVAVEVEPTNAEARVRVKDGTRTPDQVRRLRTSGVVDTGANDPVLPAQAAEQLGVPVGDETTIRHADRRKGSRRTVENGRVDLLGRHGNFIAIVEPRRSDVSIGAIVLETVDLLVDCSKQTLPPRDPKGIIGEME